MDKANAAVDLMNNGKLVDDLTTWFNASHGSCDYFLLRFLSKMSNLLLNIFGKFRFLKTACKKLFQISCISLV